MAACKFLEDLEEIRAASLVRQWAELSKHEPKCLMRDSIFWGMLNMARSVVQAYEEDEAIVRHCCVAFGGMPWRCPP